MQGGLAKRKALVAVSGGFGGFGVGLAAPVQCAEMEVALLFAILGLVLYRSRRLL